MPYAVAVDIGGTFTDLVAYDYEGQTVAYAKSPTTYGNLVDGVLNCFAKAKLDPQTADFVNHGTTLVINALIEQYPHAERAMLTMSSFACSRNCKTCSRLTLGNPSRKSSIESPPSM